MVKLSKGLFSPHFCNSLIAGATSLIKPETVDKGYRHCDIRWIRRNHRDGKKLIEVLTHMANHVREFHGVNSELTTDSLQFTTYNEGGEYRMHSDNSGKPNPLTRHRQISMVIQLNSTTEFIGGGIEIEGVGDLDLEQGDVLTFNSHQLHRAKQVVVGTRVVLVAWFFPIECSYYEEKESGVLYSAHKQNEEQIKTAMEALKQWNPE